jgi:aspartyl-tRNA(Asn)/glutamyl-tRNA(Gln) amidotransferase subunit C
MSIDRKTVDHVARLARLDLSEEERTRMQGEMTAILTHAGKIQELDLDDLEPTSHAIPLRNRMRPDVAGRCLTQEEALANAPKAEDGRFWVHRIVEDSGE